MTRHPVLMNPADQSWFYAVDDEQKGPVPFDELQRMVGTSQLPSHTLVWSEGLSDWQSYRDLTAQFASSPISPETPGATTLPQGHAEPLAAPLPIPANLKRASFLKLMIISGIAIVLLIGALGLVFFTAMPAGPGGSSTGGGAMIALTVILVIAALVMLVWSVVLSMIYVYRAWLMLQAFGASTTPGVAVGFQFIPLFNLYWAFRAYWNWSRDYNSAIRSDPRLQNAPRATEGVFLTYCICNVAAFPFNLISNIDGLELAAAVDGLLSLVSLGALIFIFVQICGAINFFVEARDRDAVGRQ